MRTLYLIIPCSADIFRKTDFENIVATSISYFFQSYFYAPAWIDLGYIVFDPVRLSVHPSVCLFVCQNFHIGYIFWLERVRAFIFHMSIPCDKTFLLVPSLRSSVKVKYQGHTFQKTGFAEGNGVLQTHLVFSFESANWIFIPFPNTP